MNTLATYYQHLGLALSLMVIATFLLAGMIKGVIGLGLPTIAMGLLGLAMAPSQAAALLIIPATLTNVWQLAFGGHLRGLVKRLWPMLLAIFIGTGAGTLWIGMAGGQWVVRSLGAALLLYALSGLLLPTLRFRRLALIPAVLGMWLGQWLRRRISAALFKRVFFIGLGVLGSHLLISG